MKKTIIQIASFTLLVGAVALTPIHSQAQASTNAPAAPKSQASELKHFHGKMIAIDQTTKTITVGRATYEITSKTKIWNGKSPGTLEDGAVGETANGTYVLEGGKKIVTRVYFQKGAAPEGEAPEKK